MSVLMTSTNSLSPSSLAPSSASFKSWERRAFDSTLGVGIAGSIHTRADAETGPASPPGGRAASALLDAQPASPGPEPTLSVMIGVEPSGSSAAASGICVEISADTGTAPANTAATARAAGTRHNLRAPSADSGRYSAASNGATNRANANRPAHAMTRLARMAVLVQYSRAVGPSSSTARMATTTPKTTLATGPSGTVLGSGIMNKAKIRISGEVTRIRQSSEPHMGVTCQLATMQWSGAPTSARATKTANAAMNPSSRPIS